MRSVAAAGLVTHLLLANLCYANHQPVLGRCDTVMTGGTIPIHTTVNTDNLIYRSHDAALDLAPISLHDRSIYFALHHQYADGHLDSLAAAADDLAALGVGALWISPVHPNTIEYMPNKDPEKPGTPNFHRYWISNHSQVDPKIGGWAALERFVAALKAKDIEPVVDLVADHAGYVQKPGEAPFTKLDLSYEDEETGEWVPQICDPTDPNDPFAGMFRRGYNEEEFIRADEALKRAITDPSAIGAVEYYSRIKWDELLAIFNHDDERVFKYIYNSYRKFIDAGIRVFRIDAFKHIPPTSFLYPLFNKLDKYAMKKGKGHLTFFCEYLSVPVYDGPPYYNYVPIDSMVRFFKSKKVPYGFYFIDFPRAYATRDLVEKKGYGFDSYAEFIKHRAHRLPADINQHYVGEAFNHDFQGRFGDIFDRQMVYLLTEFFSNTPTILFHGEERTVAPEDGRSWIPNIDREGRIGKMQKHLQSVINPLRLHPDFEKPTILFADHNRFVASKTIDGKTYLIVVNKDRNGGGTLKLNFAERADAPKVHFTTLEGDAGHFIRKSDDQSLEIDLRGASIIELKQRPTYGTVQ